MKGTPSEEDAEAERVAHQAISYFILEGDLYRKCPNGIALKCVPPEEGRTLIRDIHIGECGHHSSERTLAGKVFRSCFYWPQVLQDATTIIQTCDACQFHAKQVHQPALGLHNIPLLWPFAVRGLDILGPFPRLQGG